MRNKVIYILIVIGLLGMTTVGASAYAGRAVTDRLSQQTAQLSKVLPELRLEEQVEHGTFRSTRQVKVQLGCLPVPTKDGTSMERTSPVEVLWRDSIRHVPFVSAGGKVAAIDSALEVASAGVEQLFGTRAPLTVHTNIAADGRFESDAKLAAFKLAPKPEEELEFGGLAMHVTGSFPDGAGTFSYAGTSELIQLRGRAQDGSFAATVGPMQLTGNMQLDPAAPSFFTPYHSEMRVADLTAQLAGPGADGAAPVDLTIALRGVTAAMDNTIANDLLATTSQLRGSLNVGSFAIDKLELASALRNLHVPTLTKLTRAWLRQSLSCDAPQTPEARAAQLEQLAQGALELLPHAPEHKTGPIAIELGGKRAELSYTFGVRGVEPGSAPELMEVATKYGYANAEAKLDLDLVDQLVAYAAQLSAAADGLQQSVSLQQQDEPDPVAMIARGMLESFVQEGYLTREGEAVRARVDYEAGAVTLNGRPFELPDFGAMDLDALQSALALEDPDVEDDEEEPTDE